MDEYFSSRSYAVGYTFSGTDIALLKDLSQNCSSSSNLEKYPNISRWLRHIAALQKTDHAQVDIKLSAGREILRIIRRRVKVGTQTITIRNFFV